MRARARVGSGPLLELIGNPPPRHHHQPALERALGRVRAEIRDHLKDDIPRRERFLSTIRRAATPLANRQSLDQRLPQGRIVNRRPNFAPLTDATNVQATLVQEDGNILIAGWFDRIGNQSRNGLARLHSNGTLDLSFNPLLNSWPEVLAQRSDGKLIVLGREYLEDGPSLLHVFRLNLDGTVENHSQAPLEWDGGPRIWGLGFGHALVIGFLPDGGFILRMTVKSVAEAGPYFVWIAPDGTIDGSFFDHLGSEPNIGTIARQADGKILVHSECCSTFSVDGRFAGRLARLNPDGTLDDAYMALLPKDFLPPDGGGIVLQPDGKVLTPGGALGSIVRLNDDGTLDTTFTATPAGVLSPESHYVRRLYRQGARGVLAAVWFVGPDHPPELWRIRPGGGWDETFRVVLDSWQLESHSLTVDVADRILVSGGFTAWAGNPRQGIVRLNADGTLDQGFNPQFGLVGRVTTRGTTQQPDGRILVHVEHVLNGGAVASLFKRLLADGSVDVSFQPSAKWWFPHFLGATEGSVFTATATAEGQFRLTRLWQDGIEDPAFAFILGGFGGYSDNLVIEPDGSLLLAGHFSSVNGQHRVGLARLKPAPVWRSSTFDATGRFTGTSTGESVPFTDTAPPGTARRFYRVVKE